MAATMNRWALTLCGALSICAGLVVVIARWTSIPTIESEDPFVAAAAYGIAAGLVFGGAAMIFSQPGRTRGGRTALLLGLCGLIFAGDLLLLSAGAAAGVLYVIPMLMGLPGARRRQVMIVAVAAMVLTVVGAIFPHSARTASATIVINRAMCLLAIWATAAISIRLAEASAKQRRLASIVEGCDDAVVGMDLRGIVTDWNRGAEHMYGYAAGEMIGRSIQAIIPADRPDELAHILQAIGEGRVFGDYQTQRVCRDGQVRDVLLTISPVRDANGAITGTASIGRDITQALHFSRELADLNAELTHRNEEMEQFVYTASHDLKSPIVTMLGFAGHAQKDLAAGNFERLDQFLERIAAAGRNMRRNIDDVLALGSITRSSASTRNRIVDVRQLIDQVVDELDGEIQARSAKLEICGDLPTIRTDPVRFRHLLQNLLSNAVKHGCPRPGASVSIGFDTDDKEVCFFVRDQGPGVPPEYRQKIFLPFQRLGVSAGGTGIGLAIVKRIVELLEGRVWVESELGRGATFRVALPRRVLSADLKSVG